MSGGKRLRCLVAQGYLFTASASLRLFLLALPGLYIRQLP